MQKEQESKNECRKCRFWNHINQRTGECRRYAPGPVTNMSRWEWPKTAAFSWCGEFEPFVAELTVIEPLEYDNEATKAALVA